MVLEGPSRAENVSLENNSLLLCDHWLTDVTLSLHLAISSNSVISTEGDFAPQEKFVILGDFFFFNCYMGGMLLLSSGLKPGCY